MSNRYYCPCCGSEYTATDKITVGWAVTMCALCLDGNVVLVPEHETRVQWEARMGVSCPDNMPVWVRIKKHDDWEDYDGLEWAVLELGHIRDLIMLINDEYRIEITDDDIEVIIAHGSNKPGETVEVVE